MPEYEIKKQINKITGLMYVSFVLWIFIKSGAHDKKVTRNIAIIIEQYTKILNLFFFICVLSYIKFNI